MKIWSIFFSLLVAILIGKNAPAQTLNDKLVAEDPATLVDDARQNGDIVRGAILFHQGNINCAKCHRPTAERDRIGPDLSRMKTEVTEEFVVESILQPSKQIKEGFEAVIALTVDGRVFNGIIVNEDDQKLVIRDSQDVDKLVTILRKDLDEIRPGNKSSMPDELANELKDRQQFLDLLKYVIDIKDRGPAASSNVSASTVRRQLSSELEGLVSIQKQNCVACHKSDSTLSPVAPKQAPRLKWSGKWLNPIYIEAFIANPHTVKPGTTMPELLGQLDETVRQETANAIAHYLTSEAQNEFRPQSIDTEAARIGFNTFHSVGCVACHSPRNEDAVEQPLPDSLPLGDLRGKYNVDGLANLLEDPIAVRPSGHMPNMQLTHREAINIANFLLHSTKDIESQRELDGRWVLDSELASQGKSLFSKYNCGICHSEFDDKASRLPSKFTMADLKLENGCLSKQKGDWPNLHLEPHEHRNIRAALVRYPLQLTETQQIEVSLRSFNCIACHDRGDLGGVSIDRNSHFQTTNLNLGDQGRIPPTLTGVGAKLNRKWMRDVLVNRRTIRPYMKTRMPQYGEENVGHLLALFDSCDRLSTIKFAQFADQKETRERGLELAGNQGLNCVACHTYKYKLSDTMPAVDLTEMAERLKKDWFYQYMLEPQKFSPNTVMPSFWPGGKPIRTDIAGTPEDQIEAIWQYLIDGRQAGMPRGVVRERMEIVVSDETRMLRRSYPGIGKRGIGVGYPGGVNIAYDAEQMRLGSIWKGKFVDPGGVWSGQGSGNVRAMGRTLDFAKGPELDSLQAPWVVDDQRPPNHQFKGYELDKQRRPTFRYVLGSIEVEDFFSEFVDESAQMTHLRRRVMLSTNEKQDVRFRIASSNEITIDSDGIFTIGAQLRIRLVSDHCARIVEEAEGKRLEIPIELVPGQKQKLVYEYLWE